VTQVTAFQIKFIIIFIFQITKINKLGVILLPTPFMIV